MSTSPSPFLPHCTYFSHLAPPIWHAVTSVSINRCHSHGAYHAHTYTSCDFPSLESFISADRTSSICPFFLLGISTATSISLHILGSIWRTTISECSTTHFPFPVVLVIYVAIDPCSYSNLCKVPAPYYLTVNDIGCVSRCIS